ncbi:Mitochondrial morphology and cristae structure 1 [Carabus blaptoides fortunei]
MNILTRKGIMTQVINMLAIIGTGVAAHNIEYNPGFGPKQLAWLLYVSVMGIMFTPILIGPNIDKGALTIGSVGIGTLFIYKLGLLNQPEKIKTYVYLGCSIAVAVASAKAVLYSPVIMNILTRKGIMTQVINMLAIIGTGVAAHNIEYNPGFGPKQLAWLLYVSVMGIMFTPILIGPNIDKGALTIGSVGIGTLFIYKLGLLNQPDNIKIYVYLGCSIAVAVASAKAALYSPVIMNILTRKGIMTQVINMLAIIGTGVAAHNIEYNPGFGPKQLAWLLYVSVMGIMFTPILIGPISRRAMHTTGVVVGLYIIATCAPKETLYDPIKEALSIFMDILNIFIRIAAMFAKVANKNK